MNKTLKNTLKFSPLLLVILAVYLFTLHMLGNASNVKTVFLLKL